MGAWGFGVFDSDSALDVRDQFEDLLKKSESGYEAVIALENEYATEMDDSQVAMVVAYMAIAFGSLTRSIKEQTLAAIDEELKDRLEDWTEPEERRSRLKAFRYFLEAESTLERTKIDN